MSTPSTTTLPLATAALAADWVVILRVLEEEVSPADTKASTRTTTSKIRREDDVDNQAGVGVGRRDGAEDDGVPRGPTSCH